MFHGPNLPYFQDSSSTVTLDSLRLKHCYKTKPSEKHTFTALPLVVQKTYSNSLFFTVYIDKSDCAAHPYSASLFSCLPTLYPLTDCPICQVNNFRLNSEFIHLLRQDFCTFGNLRYRQPLWDFGSTYPWCLRPHRITCCTRVRFISELIKSLHVEKPLCGPRFSRNFPPDKWFWSRLILPDYPSRAHQLGMDNYPSLSHWLSCTNNNGLSSDPDAITTPVVMKPRCQRARSTLKLTTVTMPLDKTGSSGQRLDKIDKPLILNLKANSVTEDLDDLDDEVSGSLNSDEPLKTDPVAYFTGPVHSLKPPASPRRALIANSKPKQHRRSRSSSRNGLSFDRVKESDSQVVMSIDDSVKTMKSCSTPKPRKRHQSITQLNSRDLILRDDVGLLNEIRSWKMNQICSPTVSKMSDKVSTKPEPLPRPIQRSLGSTTLSNDDYTMEKNASITAQQTLCSFKQSSRSKRTLVHPPQQRTSFVIDLISVWSLSDCCSRLAANTEQNDGIRLFLYSPIHNIFPICMYHSAQITLCVPPILCTAESYICNLWPLSKALAQSGWSWTDYQFESMHGESAPRSNDIVDRNAPINKPNGDQVPGQTSEGHQNPVCLTESEIEKEQSRQSVTVAHLNGSSAFIFNINAGNGDVSVSQSTGTVSLDLVTQLRQARDKVQRKIDELLTRLPMDEPVVLSASCEQLRTFLGQLEAYNFRVGTVRARSQSANCSKSLNGADRDIDMNELETIWSTVVQQVEIWINTLQKAFVESKMLEQILEEFRRDLNFAEARLNPPGQSTTQTERHSSYQSINSPSESNTTEERPNNGVQAIPSTGQVPTALRLVRVIRFRLSGWYAHVSLLLLIADGTHVLSTLTRVQSGRLVFSRLTTDITTENRLKKLRACVGHLVDEAERLLTAWSTHRSRGLIPLSMTHTSRTSSISLATSLDADLGARSRLPVLDRRYYEDQNAKRYSLKQFRDPDSNQSSDIDDNVEELVSVTSRSSVSLESDESDHLMNYDKDVDVSWASETTAHSVVPSDNTSCGLTVTLSQHSHQSVTAPSHHQSERNRTYLQPNPDSNPSPQSGEDFQLFTISNLGNASPKTVVGSLHDNETDPVSCNSDPNPIKPEESEILTDEYTEFLVPPAQLTTPPDLPNQFPSDRSSIDLPFGLSHFLSPRYLSELWNQIPQWLSIRLSTRDLGSISSSEIRTASHSVDSSPPVRLWSHFMCDWPMHGPLLRWSNRPWNRGMLIGTVFALFLVITFPYFVHLLLVLLSIFSPSEDAQIATSCVYRWSRLFSWFPDTQEMGPGRTLAKTWPRHAPPF